MLHLTYASAFVLHYLQKRLTPTLPPTRALMVSASNVRAEMERRQQAEAAQSQLQEELKRAGEVAKTAQAELTACKRNISDIEARHANELLKVKRQSQEDITRVRTEAQVVNEKDARDHRDTCARMQSQVAP